MDTDFAERMKEVKPSAIRELLRLGADSSIISFGGGYPDPSLFPLEALAGIFDNAIMREGRTALQYTEATGTPRLRELIAARMLEAGVSCKPQNVLVLQGAQQGLDLVAKMFIDSGDIILTEDPTFLGALIAFNPYQPQYRAVPMDDEGMDMDALESILRREKIKFVYTIPDFQNPTGKTMSLARRKRLVALASQYGFHILEDCPYREIWFDNKNLPTLYSLDTEGRVIYLGSFSKILAPGLRLGWAVAPEALIQQLGLLKLAADTQCSTLNMAVTAHFLVECDVEAHLGHIRSSYRHKRDVMLDAIRRHFPRDVRFTEPDGGMFTWLTFPEEIDTARFMHEVAIPKAKVAYVPGATFFPVAERKNHARISFATQSDEMIEIGISALGRELHDYLSSNR